MRLSRRVISIPRITRSSSRSSASSSDARAGCAEISDLRTHNQHMTTTTSHKTRQTATSIAHTRKLDVPIMQPPTLLLPSHVMFEHCNCHANRLNYSGSHGAAGGLNKNMRTASSESNFWEHFSSPRAVRAKGLPSHYTHARTRAHET